VDTQSAFAYCEQLTREHYENFPVASLFVPADRRPFVSSIYAFARTADDFADEGTVAPCERLRKIDEWEAKLDGCFAGRADHPVFIALAETIAKTGIPREPLSALLKAFRMDVTKQSFGDFAELLEYCDNSANPVGQLVLHILGEANDTTVPLSNSVCTGLQLANFWQDVSIDMAMGRVYIPLEDLDRFGYTKSDLGRRILDDRFRELMRFQVERTRTFFRAGEPILREVGRRLRFELSLTLGGGSAILDKIQKIRYDVLTHRPRLSTIDKLTIASAAVLRASL
jgi:squalene synthase HpnC